MQAKSRAWEARRSRVALGALVAFGIAVGGCSPSTTLQGSWKDPSFAGPPLKNVLVVAAVQDPTVRRAAEDIVLGELKAKSVGGTASYTVYPDGIPNVDALKAHVVQNGYDGVIVSRLTSKKDEQYYVPPTYSTVGMPGYGYGGWYGWYGGVYSSYVSPGYVGTETQVLIDTSVWAVQGAEKGKLIWTGTTESIDPKSATEVTKQISDLILPKLRASGII